MEEALLKYVEQHSDEEPDNLYRLKRATNIHLLNGRMCSGHLQGRLLKMIVCMIRPERVLELGTFSGYSAISMAEGLPAGGLLETVESDDELEDFIMRAIEESDMKGKIRLHISDALSFMKNCVDETYDLIFIDADKREYLPYYLEAKRIVRNDGFILADNTLWDGHVLEETMSRDAQTRGIKEFNDYVAADNEAQKVMLPIRDGLTLIRIRKEPKEVSDR